MGTGVNIKGIVDDRSHRGFCIRSRIGIPLIAFVWEFIRGELEESLGLAYPAASRSWAAPPLPSP